MTEKEWLACTDPEPMLEVLRGKASDRKLRLFAVACCRRALVLRDNPASTTRALELISVLEAFADGDPDGLIHPEDRQWIRDNQDYEPFFLICEENATKLSLVHPRDGALTASDLVLAVAQNTAIQEEKERRCRIEKQRLVFVLRDVLGDPFRPMALNPTWLTPTVTNLATVAYQHRAIPSGELDTARLAILADALEDDGCDNAEILNHLRGPGPHVRGFFALDLLLGKG